MTTNKASKSISMSKGAGINKPPQNLQLVDNDYFSLDDKHVSHLRNLTQKAMQSHPGGAPWQWLNS